MRALYDASSAEPDITVLQLAEVRARFASCSSAGLAESQ